MSDASNTPSPLPQWERPPGTPSERASRYIAATLGKGLLYALSFWAVYAFVYTPLYYAMHKGDQTASAEAHSEMQMKAWDEQAKHSAEMLREGELMQKRYETIMTRQEQLVDRVDTVVSAWERQIGAKK
jgi:hypothetical protein